MKKLTTALFFVVAISSAQTNTQKISYEIEYESLTFKQLEPQDKAPYVQMLKSKYWYVDAKKIKNVKAKYFLINIIQK